MERNHLAQVAPRALHQAQNLPLHLHVLALEQLLAVRIQAVHIQEEIGTTTTQIILTTLTTVTMRVTTTTLTTLTATMKTKTTSTSAPSQELHTAQAAT